MFPALCLAAAGLYGQTPSELTKAQQEVERIRSLVAAGAMPRNALDNAEQVIEDAKDNETLSRTLYGALTVQDLNEQQAEEMVTAARNRLNRQIARMERNQKLIAAGVAAPSELEGSKYELESRRITLNLAENRAKLLQQLAEMTHLEAKYEEEALAAPMGAKIAQRFDGTGRFTDKDFVSVEVAYSTRFHAPLPVSAKGETALHKSLGFDHRGRVDVALNPDQPEGLWLRHYLESAKIPYFAFRSAVAGQATAPHIHLGPPSLRLRAAD